MFDCRDGLSAATPLVAGSGGVSSGLGGGGGASDIHWEAMRARRVPCSLQQAEQGNRKNGREVRKGVARKFGRIQPRAVLLGGSGS